MGRKIRYEEVIKSFEKEGYKVLTPKEKYINSSTKVKFKCPKNHIYSYAVSKWNFGFRCPYCSGAFTWFDDIVKEFEKEDLKIITNKEEFKSLKETKLSYICSNGHIHTIDYAQFRRGQRCPYCSGSKTYYLSIKKSFEKEGYEILTSEDRYKSNKPIKFKCSKDHVHKIEWGSWKKGSRCYYCAKLGRSKTEVEICEFLDNLNINYESNDRTMIKSPYTGRGLELDIWMPDRLKAIEVNGEYWHSSKDKIRNDKIKEKFCIRNGIEFLIIYYTGWIRNKEKIKNIIKEFVE